jgi:hypothetical protein
MLGKRGGGPVVNDRDRILRVRKFEGVNHIGDRAMDWRSAEKIRRHREVDIGRLRLSREGKRHHKSHRCGAEHQLFCAAEHGSFPSFHVRPQVSLPLVVELIPSLFCRLANANVFRFLTKPLKRQVEA